MDEISLLGGLHEIINADIKLKLDKWFDKHNNPNYYLVYPLIMTELGNIYC